MPRLYFIFIYDAVDDYDILLLLFHFSLHARRPDLFRP